MKNKYRIVHGSNGGYNVQKCYWWFPFVWMTEIEWLNDWFRNIKFYSIEEAEEYINRDRQKVIKEFK